MATIQAKDKNANNIHRNLGIPKIDIMIESTANKATEVLIIKAIKYKISPPVVYSSKAGKYIPMNCRTAPATPIR